MYSKFVEYIVYNKNAESDWLETQFKPFAKRAMIHIIRANLHRMPRHQGLFEVFGIDFLMDSDMKL